MPLPVVYRLVAKREKIEAARTYESLRPGAGSLFLDEVARIERHLSNSWPLSGGVRADPRAVLRRFPYGLFYVEEGERDLVLACLDLRRDPQALGDAIGHR